jgi:hypothetical protein
MRIALPSFAAAPVTITELHSRSREVGAGASVQGVAAAPFWSELKGKERPIARMIGKTITVSSRAARIAFLMMNRSRFSNKKEPDDAGFDQ